MNPEEAVRAHLDVTDAGRGVFVPHSLGHLPAGAAPVVRNPSNGCWLPPGRRA